MVSGVNTCKCHAQENACHNVLTSSSVWHCTEKWLKNTRIMNNNNENKVVGQYTLTGGQLHQHPLEPLLLAVERMGKPSHEIVG